MRTKTETQSGRAHDAAYKPIRTFSETVEKSVKQLPTAPQLDYNPFVQRQRQSNGATQPTPQSDKK
jgi:hypothetical protein